MAAKGPLRKVIREFTTYRHAFMLGDVPVHWEELECGHVMHPRTDIYGEYFSARRRCKQCYKEKNEPKKT